MRVQCNESLKINYVLPQLMGGMAVGHTIAVRLALHLSLQSREDTIIRVTRTVTSSCLNRIQGRSDGGQK